jgi:predicted NBD/HSP70 family sugar kinase
MFIVFDIGGTNTRVAASKDGKTLQNVTIYPTPQLYTEGIDRLATTAKQLAGDSQITSIAGGVPGPLNAEHSQLLKAPNIKDWNNKPLKQDLEQQLHTKAYIENDTAMWGLGEAHAGSGKGQPIVVYITVSTGIGGCRIVHGRIDSSAFGFEIGHHTINPNGPMCGCGGSGHLEAFCGGSALEKRYGTSPKDISDPAVWEDVAHNLALGLLNTCVFWSPNMIVLGGSVMKSVSIERVHFFMQSLNAIVDTLPSVQLSTLQDTGGLFGSLSVASGDAP